LSQQQLDFRFVFLNPQSQLSVPNLSNYLENSGNFSNQTKFFSLCEILLKGSVRELYVSPEECFLGAKCFGSMP